MRRSLRIRVDRWSRAQVAQALRFQRSWDPFEEGCALKVETTLEPILDDRRERWTWRVRASIGRRSCLMYTESSWHNRAPLEFEGRSADATDAAMDARQVEGMIRSHYAELINRPGPITTTTVG